MAQLDRRGHRHFWIFFIGLYDLWSRRIVSAPGLRQRGGGGFSSLKKRLPASLAAVLPGSILACGGGGAAADKGGPPLAAPLITSQPSSQTVTAGASTSFTAAASGHPTPTFTWERSHDSGGTWAAISAANAATYTLTTAKADHQAQFRAKAANSVDTVVSEVATLSVDAPIRPAWSQVAAGSTHTVRTP